MAATVLVVDDDTETVRTFGGWLRLEGYQVRTAGNGQEALMQIAGADAIILDLRMPILDGLGFLRQVRERHSRVPVAIVTGDYLVDESLLIEFRRLNAQVLFKPLWGDDLVTLATAMVEEALVSNGL